MGKSTPTPSCRHVAFTGHRPHRIGFWSSLLLPGRIRKQMIRLQKARPKPTLYCGLAEGADQMAALIAIRLGWTLSIIIPSPHEDEVRKSARKRTSRTARIFQKASEIRIARPNEHESDPYRVAAEMMLDDAECLIAVHDGGESAGPGGTHDVIDLALQLGITVHEILIPPR